MSNEIHLTVNDDVETYVPSFDAGMTIVDGKATYWIIDRVEQYSANDKGGQTRQVVERDVEVSAEVWRDAVQLLRVAEIRQVRALLKEALDPNVEGTLASDLRRIADHTSE